LSYPRIASLKTGAAFRAHLERSGIALGFDEQLAPPAASPLAQPIEIDSVRIGNRFCILPMEGWDGTREGEPSELTRRRWRHFGISGAKLMWGGEAVAVRHDGRANPNQLMLTRKTERAIASLRGELIASHRERFGSNADADLFIGLQLTHSGRFARPDAYDRPAPLAGAAHPLLDRRFPSAVRILTDEELDRLIDDFVAAAGLARDCGFQFVDVKACHGYLGHELLGARSRDGKYGGVFENRTRFMRRIIEGIRANVPGLRIVVRVSAFDTVPFRKRPDGVGEPEDSRAVAQPFRAAFGFGIVADDATLDAALEEARALLRMLEGLGVRWICVTGGSPYYNPHVQRPAMFPPLDGYEPPEDPLRGVARQINATALLKQSFPNLVFVGSAYSYLQEWLPHVAQHVIRNGMADFVGLGRMVLAYPELPADVLAGRPLRRGSICRTFSDCTTGPRLGLVSGCFPLDKFYAGKPEAIQIRDVRTRSARSLALHDDDESAGRASLSGERSLSQSDGHASFSGERGRT
jgi:2,4-dienoyl-CoA reductase-like NADH-dependent reductase (Old Yellow Enzyme family)